MYMWREMDKAVFRAALPPILSAVKVSGDGGIRLQLDIPECDEAEALRLLLWRERVLVVTIEPESYCKTVGNNALDKRTKRKSGWTPAEGEGAN